jgi:hypothetical protein
VIEKLTVDVTMENNLIILQKKKELIPREALSKYIPDVIYSTRIKQIARDITKEIPFVLQEGEIISYSFFCLSFPKYLFCNLVNEN